MLFSLWSNSVTRSRRDGGSAAEKELATKTALVLLAHRGLFSLALLLCLQ